ncbi:uncharacterized protein BT62DRAFT_1013822 [Guyanagaster necrorhizus]|uniref:Uncharacterized protein n=1 Tax=Guyanagaster necrorhizus TaxID=856835 RepID=A0A9P7VG53_9AGAR|nr:uncharacterized protein BT62DRAFT_1013822 [Guyanagaster necrorhizus MCA 3950]KAG7439526.1 hypothetical protein BT62DRAFT_1013822 [Guyanagaster necrorhizus MCA 3950]
MPERSSLRTESLSEFPIAGSQTSPIKDQSSEMSHIQYIWDSPWPEHDLRPYEMSKCHGGVIAAFTETGQAESSIKVPEQRAYSGRKPIIPSPLADIPCTTLGVQGLLNQLNTTLGTSHTLANAFIFSLLEDYISKLLDTVSKFTFVAAINIQHLIVHRPLIFAPVQFQMRTLPLSKALEYNISLSPIAFTLHSE